MQIYKRTSKVSSWSRQAYRALKQNRYVEKGASYFRHERTKDTEEVTAEHDHGVPEIDKGCNGLPDDHGEKGVAGLCKMIRRQTELVSWTSEGN